MRKLIPMPRASFFTDEGMVDDAISFSRANRVSPNEIRSAERENMLEGEMQIDGQNDRLAFKKNGKVHKLALNADNEIILTEL